MAVDTRPFEIHLTGEISGKLWDGKFSSKVRLSHREYMLEDQHRRMLLGDRAEYASLRVQNAAIIFSTIASHLVGAPEWWTANRNGEDLEDENIIQAVYDHVIRIENEWLEERKKQAGEAKVELKETLAEMKGPQK